MTRHRFRVIFTRPPPGSAAAASIRQAAPTLELRIQRAACTSKYMSKNPRRGVMSMPMSQVRAQLASVLQRAEQGQAVEVTRGGRAVAVVVPVPTFEQMRAPSAREGLDRFLAATEPRTLAGPDPWRDVRDRSPGRRNRW